MTLPVAILCGGRGTRSGLPFNKCFVDISGKPFMLHQLEWLEEQGFLTVVLCRGNDGTLRALRRAAPQLGRAFLILYGDTLLPIDLDEFEQEWRASGKAGATAFYQGEDGGVNVCSLQALHRYAGGVNFNELRDHYLSRGQWLRWDAPVGWVEVGTPTAIETARKQLA